MTGRFLPDAGDRCVTPVANGRVCIQNTERNPVGQAPIPTR